MKKLLILATLLSLGQTSWAQIRDFQTTRLNSTAGAGVASVLATEAAVLNPATASFFDHSSFSYQSYSTRLRRESDLRDNPGNDFPDNNRSQGFFMADHSGPVKGGVAYINQRENNYLRKQYVLHSAASIGPDSALGFSYRYIEDSLPNQFSNTSRQHHQLTVGGLFVINTSTLLGFTLVDPTRTTPGEERLVAGFQYNLTDKFTLIGDAGAQYTRAFDDKHFWKAAVQINVFSDFFLRVGRSYDNITKFKGTGWGAGWIGPRLGVEFAQKISDQFARNSYIFKDESLVDTSLSAVLKF